MKKILSAVLTIAFVMQSAFIGAVKAEGFSDLKGHWAETEITAMVDRGVVTGKSNGVFAPDDVVTRAEYIALVCRALGKKEAQYAGTYTDMTGDEWYAPYVQAALDAGMIPDGMTRNDKFLGDTPITREEIAVISVLAEPQDVTGIVNTTLYEDFAEISEWAMRDMAKAIELGIITGVTDTRLAPKANATRAEAIVMLSRFAGDTGVVYDAAHPNNVIVNDYTDLSRWSYTVKAGGRAQNCAEATVKHLANEGSSPEDGCIFYDVEWSGGGKVINALQMKYELHSPTAIEIGKTYKVGFKAKLVSDEPKDQKIEVNVVKFRDVQDNNITWSTEIEKFTITENEEWTNYEVTLVANADQQDVVLIYQFGGDQAENLKLYFDDFYWIATTKTQNVLVNKEIKLEAGEGTDPSQVKLSGGGSMAADVVPQLVATSNSDSGLILDYWRDPYGNKATPNSTYVCPAERSYTYKAFYKSYDYSDKGFTAPVSDAFDVSVSEPAVTRTSAMASARVSIPEGYRLLDSGVLFYPGYWTENFNIFSENAENIPAASVSANGEFSAQTVMTTRYGVLARAYAIAQDADGQVHVQYSDAEYKASASAPEKIEHQGMIYHELLAIFTDSNPNDPESHAAFIDQLAPAGCDVVAVTPSAYKTNVWNSQVDGYWTGEAKYEEKKSMQYPEDIKTYILGGGDPVQDTIDGIRRNDLYIFIDQRMNDCHNSEDLTFPTHSAFFRNNPQYWLRDSSANTLHRAFNYLNPGVQDYFYSLIEELVTNYDIDGVQLDFQRHLNYFQSYEVAMGTPVLTEYVGKIRELVNRASIDRGKDIQLSVRLPYSPEASLGYGFDAEEWCRREYLDLLNVGNDYKVQLTVDIEGYKKIANGAKVFGQIHYLTYQLPTNSRIRRYITEHTAYATANNYFARGADGIYFFNLQYVPDAANTIYPKLPVVFDEDELARAEKNYIFTRGLDHGFGSSATGGDFNFNVVLPEDTQYFSSAIARVEYAGDCTNTVTEVTVNGVKLNRINRSESEFFTPVQDNEAFAAPEKVMFFEIPLSALINGENNIVIDTVSGATGNVDGLQIAYFK